ncbi:uncharacterized protein LOC144556463 isoform X2 [Carex rostrata]
MFGQMDSGIANPFGSSNLNSFGGASTSASVFGQTSVPTFGTSSSSSSSSSFSCSFGQKMGSFGGVGLSPNQPNPFTGTGSAFSVSSCPAFEASSGFSFGPSSSPGSGPSSSFSFGMPSAPAFGSSSSSAFVFGSTPAFSSQFSFGTQSGQQVGDKNEAYKWSPHDEQSNAKTESISAMPSFKDSSYQELRLSDYQCSDKGEPSALTGGPGFQKTSPSSPFGATSIFGPMVSNPNFFSFTSQSTPNTSPFSSISKSNMNPCSSVTESNPNPFSMKQSNPTSFCLPSQSNQNQTHNLNSYRFSFTSQSKENQNASHFSFTSKSKQNQNQNQNQSSNPNPNPSSFFPQSNPNPNANSFSFTSQSNQNKNPFSSFAKDSNQNPFSSPFAANHSPIFSSSSTSSSKLSVFGSVTTQAMGTPAAGINANTTQATGLTQCTTSGFGQQPSNGSWSGRPPFGQATPPPTTAAAASVSTPSFEAMTTGQTSNVFSFGNNNDALTSQGGIGASASNQQVTSQTATSTTAAPSGNLFSALPSAPEVSTGLCCTISSVQYGISSLPVGDRSAPSRGSLSVPRHLSQRRVRLPLRRYHTKTDAPKVAFDTQRQEAFYAPKLDAFVIPRQNPRKVTVTDPAIVNNDDWLGDEVCDKLPNHLESHLPVPNSPTNQNGEHSDPTASPSFEQEDDLDDCDLNLDENDENAPPPSTVDCNHSTQKGLQAAIVYEHGAEIEALMPKLRHADYYTEPRIQDLAARERADPGFCSRVPGFVVGRTGYGCIQFLGETDVRKLDLEAIVQFGNKEVVVYRDEKKKPIVGQGLNKPAEVALLNIKCINKKTGERYLTGPKVERYKEMLTKRTVEQGGEFLSYDPVKAEWRFKVKHFSQYGLFLPPP